MTIKYQWLTDKMAENDYIIEKLIQMAALGARGNGEKVKIQALRLIRSLQADGHPSANRLKEAIFSETDYTGSIHQVQRSGLSSPVPLDKETGLSILNVDDPVELPMGFIGSDEVKGPINDILNERKKIKELTSAGIIPTSKILFTGPPGVGKTVCAKYIAKKLNRPLLTLDLATVISSLLGKTGSNIKMAMRFACETPCVLLLDEFDAIAKMRDDGSDIGEVKRLVTVILQELDQWAGHNILIAATNHYHLLDPAIHRRFDQTIEFGRPTRENLKKVGLSLIRENGNVPKEWVLFLAIVMENTSYSDFQREVNNLRKSFFLYGEKGAQEFSIGLLSKGGTIIEKDKRLEIALKLVREYKISQRAASKIASISRGTLKKYLED